MPVPQAEVTVVIGARTLLGLFVSVNFTHVIYDVILERTIHRCSPSWRLAVQCSELDIERHKRVTSLDTLHF